MHYALQKGVDFSMDFYSLVKEAVSKGATILLIVFTVMFSLQTIRL